MLCRLVLVCVVAILFGFALEPGPARATPLVPTAAAEAVRPEAAVERTFFFFRRHSFRRHRVRRHRVRRHRYHYGRHHHRRRGRHVRVERRDRVPTQTPEAPAAGAAAPQVPTAPNPEPAPSRPPGRWVEPGKAR